MAGKAIRQLAFGPSQQLQQHQPQDVLEVVLKPIPRASPAHVVVRMLISVVNPIDITFIRECRLSAFKDTEAIPGSEGVGIVHEVGEGVTSFKVGERVVPVIYWNYLIDKGQGAWQNYLEVHEDDLFSLPESIPDEVASLFVICPWTVYGLLFDLAIPKGEYLLQTAGASVIGRLVIQLANHLGIKTISLIRREEWRDELLKLGANEVINGAEEDVVSKVLEISGSKGAYAAIDVLSGTSTKVAAACVRDYGDIYVYGTMLSADVIVSASDLMRKVNVTFWNLTRFLKDKKKKNQLLEDVPRLLEKKILTPLVGKKFKLEDIKAAILETQRSARGGKVLLLH